MINCSLIFTVCVKGICSLCLYGFRWMHFLLYLDHLCISIVKVDSDVSMLFEWCNCMKSVLDVEQFLICSIQITQHTGTEHIDYIKISIWILIQRQVGTQHIVALNLIRCCIKKMEPQIKTFKKASWKKKKRLNKKDKMVYDPKWPIVGFMA